MQYPVLITQEDNGYMVTFRDIPEALTCGDSLEDAREMALDALITALDFYFETQRPIPMPSEMQKGEELISLPSDIMEKILLHNKNQPQT